MQAHGPKNLQGPIRGTPGWWEQLGKTEKGNEATATARKKRAKKSGHRNYTRSNGNAIRADLVQRVRQEIEDGVYETTEKWEAALERLLENL